MPVKTRSAVFPNDSPTVNSNKKCRKTKQASATKKKKSQSKDQDVTEISHTLKTKSTKKAKITPKVEFCYTKCKLGRCLDQNMIQCCSCMQHFHKKCADLKSNHISNIWNCDYCRSLPKRLDTLTSHVEEMKVQLTKLCDLNSDLLGQISQKTIDFEKL